MTHLTRRNLVEAVTLGATTAADWDADRDRALARLIAEHHRFDEAILAAEDEADALLIGGRRLGGKRSAAAEAACARAEALHEAQGGVANAIINTPAVTVLGAAYKLILCGGERPRFRFLMISTGRTRVSPSPPIATYCG